MEGQTQMILRVQSLSLVDQTKFDFRISTPEGSSTSFTRKVVVRGAFHELGLAVNDADILGMRIDVR